MDNINPNPKSSASQCALISEWLLSGKTLTSLDALVRFGCMRLASRIHDLRRRGMDITSTKIQVESGKYVTEYSLSKYQLK